MKKIVLVALLGIMGFCANAQTQVSVVNKFGYIDSRELLAAMPEAKKADTDLQAYGKTLEDALKTMYTDYEAKGKAYGAQEKSMTDAMKEVKQKELMDLEKRIQDYTQDAQNKIAAKREEIYKPILEKADKAIKDTAKEKGFTYVFDTSSGGLLYAQESDNILALVKAKLGIK